MGKIKNRTEDECYNILKRHLFSKAIKTIEHSIRVRYICEEIVCELNKEIQIEINTTLLYRAAILHDIAKFDGEDKHHKKAKNILKMQGVESKKVFSIIKAHKGKFTPNDNVIVESAILRMADKIDKFNKYDANRTCIENLFKIKCFYKENGLEDYKLFKISCNRVIKRYQNFTDVDI